MNPCILPSSLLVVNGRFESRPSIGGTPNDFGVIRTADKTFKLIASGQDNYGARFYGIK